MSTCVNTLKRLLLILIGVAVATLCSISKYGESFRHLPFKMDFK